MLEALLTCSKQEFHPNEIPSEPSGNLKGLKHYGNANGTHLPSVFCTSEGCKQGFCYTQKSCSNTEEPVPVCQQLDYHQDAKNITFRSIVSSSKYSSSKAKDLFSVASLSHMWFKIRSKRDSLGPKQSSNVQLLRSGISCARRSNCKRSTRELVLSFIPEVSVERKHSNDSYSVFESSTKTINKVDVSPASVFLSRISDPVSSTCLSLNVSILHEGDMVGKYLIGPSISKGAFSFVYAAVKASRKESKKDDISASDFDLALKAVRSEYVLPGGVRIGDIATNEIAVWSHLNHKNIVRIIDFMRCDNIVFIVSELMKGGNMLTYLESCGGKFSELEAKRLFLMVLSGIHYMHTVGGFAHGDLKFENILIDSCGVVKIADFGISMCINDEFLTSELSSAIEKASQTAFFGSMVYCSPEVVSCYPPSSKKLQPSDIWSLGCILYAMVTGVLPFNDSFLPRLRIAIISGSYDADILKQNKLSIQIQSQIAGMLAVDPMRRLTASEIMEGNWINS